MAGINLVIVKPYKSNGIIVINNNTGGANSAYIYTISYQKYSNAGVLSTPAIVLDNNVTPIDDTVKYGTTTGTINGVFNPYDSSSEVVIDKQLGVDVQFTTDGVYRLTIARTGETKYVDFTIINGILHCRKQYMDLILRNQTCTECNNNATVKNYLEFNNLYATIMNYSNHMQLFLPYDSIISPVEYASNINNLYILIERANNYCVFCSNCEPCKS